MNRDDTTRSTEQAVSAHPILRAIQVYAIQPLLYVLILFLLLIYHVVGELTPWGEYFAVMPPMVWLLGLIPLCIFAYDRERRKPFWIGVLAVLIFIGTTEEWLPLIRGLSPAPSASESSDELSLNLVTWNIDGGSDKAAILKAVAGADLCFFQETAHGRRSFQPEDLRGEWEAFHWLDAGDCGILSRYPFRAIATREVGPWSAPQVMIVDLPGSRTLVVANVRLMLPSLALDIWNSDARRQLAAGNRERLTQYGNLAALIDEVAPQGSSGVVLAGDFNTGSWSKMLGPLKQVGLRDAWHSSGRGWGRTVLSDIPVARVDQIWFRGEALVPVSAVASKGPVSDHRMVRLRLLVR